MLGGKDIDAFESVNFVHVIPEGMQKDPEATAETIENNVRRRIIEKSGTNPLYYAKMSELLAKIIEDRKKKKDDYKDYLRQIAELTKRVERPEEYADYPAEVKQSAAMRALYDNMPGELKTVEMVLALHNKIITVKPDK